MNHEEHNSQKTGLQNCCGGHKTKGFNWNRLIMIVLIGTAVFFLVTEHQGYFFRFLPYLLLLACPLMHLFHGRHHDHENKESQNK